MTFFIHLIGLKLIEGLTKYTADSWGFPEVPADVTTKYNVPFWVKAVAYAVQPLNPLWALRAAGESMIDNDKVRYLASDILLKSDKYFVNKYDVDLILNLNCRTVGPIVGRKNSTRHHEEVQLSREK